MHRNSDIPEISAACYMLLLGKANLVFPGSTISNPSSKVFLYANTKTPKWFLSRNPMAVVDWYTWRKAIIPVLNNEAANPNSPINLGIDMITCVNIIKALIEESYRELGIMPP